MFDLLQQNNKSIKNEIELNNAIEQLTDGLYSDDVVVNEGVVNYFQRTLSAIKNKTQEINAENLANLMAGLKVLGQPQAADVITASDLKQAGCCHNVTDPATIATFEEEEEVRASVANIGRTYGRKDSPVYAELVKHAQSSGELKELVGTMREILDSHRRPTVGIKQTMDQNRVNESAEENVARELKEISNDWEYIVHEAGLDDAKEAYMMTLRKAKRLGMKLPMNFPDGSPLPMI